MCSEVTVTVGKEYGNVPGHRFHDVTVTIRKRKTGRWPVRVLETWGVCQPGHNEEHGGKEVVGRGEDLNEAVADAERLAERAGINTEYLAQALCQAADEAEDEAEEGV